MCDHCTAMDKVLTDLMGRNVADVIMRRVKKRLHDEGDSRVAQGELASAIVTRAEKASP